MQRAGPAPRRASHCRGVPRAGPKRPVSADVAHASRVLRQTNFRVNRGLLPIIGYSTRYHSRCGVLALADVAYRTGMRAASIALKMSTCRVSDGSSVVLSPVLTVICRSRDHARGSAISRRVRAPAWLGGPAVRTKVLSWCVLTGLVMLGSHEARREARTAENRPRSLRPLLSVGLLGGRPRHHGDERHCPDDERRRQVVAHGLVAVEDEAHHHRVA